MKVRVQLAPGIYNLREAESDSIQVVMDSDGIGDAILGLTAVAGLQRDGKNVIYSVKPWLEEWVRLFVVEIGSSDGPAFYPGATYAAQVDGRPRWVHYAEACGTVAALPVVKPLVPDERYRNKVLLAPFSGWARPGNPNWHPNSRVWLQSHWLALEALLEGCVILDGRTEDRERTWPFKSPVLFNESAERVAAAMLAAKCVIGNDSGMVHLAGALGVPAIVLSGPVRGAQIFGIYPTVKTLDGLLPCTGCHWQGNRGWHPVCDAMCASLQMIHPSDVKELI